MVLSDMLEDRFIVKIQTPLASSEEDAPFLVYDETKEFHDFIDDSNLKRKIKIALSGESKGYFWMQCKDGQYFLDLNTVVLYQPW